MHHYVEVDAEKVSPEVRREVDRMRWYVAEDLGISPTVRYFEETNELSAHQNRVVNRLEVLLGMEERITLSDARPLAGFYATGIPEAVWIDPDTTPEKAAGAVAHEMRHAWQHTRGWMQSTKKSDREADARAYQEKATVEYEAWYATRLHDARLKHGTDPRSLAVKAMTRLLPVIEKAL